MGNDKTGLMVILNDSLFHAALRQLVIFIKSQIVLFCNLLLGKKRTITITIYSTAFLLKSED